VPAPLLIYLQNGLEYLAVVVPCGVWEPRASLEDIRAGLHGDQGCSTTSWGGVDGLTRARVLDFVYCASEEPGVLAKKASGSCCPKVTSSSTMQLLADVGLTRQELVAALGPRDVAAIRCSKTLVVSGGWGRASATAKRLGGAALGAVCDLLAARLGAKRAIIRGARYSPQLTHPRRSTPRLVAFLASSPRP
jgi:hypothetical protein